MANQLTVSSSYKAILDTTSIVANQTYVESALDQIVGSNSGVITDTYDEAKASVTVGCVLATGTGVLPSVAGNFWKVSPAPVVTGTEPILTDPIRVVFIKAGAITGNAANTIEVLCANGTVSMALLAPGQSILLMLDDAFSEITAKALYYNAGVDEIQCTVALIGA